MTFLCLSCRGPGHKTADCPTAPPTRPPASQFGGELDWTPLAWEAPTWLPADEGSDLCVRCCALRIPDLLLRDDVRSEGKHVFRAAEVAGAPSAVLTDHGHMSPRIEASRHNDNLARSLGSFKDIVLVQNCPLCRLLFALFPRAADPDQRPDADAEFELRPLRIYDVVNVAQSPNLAALGEAASQYAVAVTIMVKAEGGRNAVNLLATGIMCPPRPAFALTSGVGLAARLRPPRVDPSLLTSWMHRCDRDHGASCAPRWTDDLLTTTMLDVQTCQLVPCPPHARYLALSYVWGRNVKPGRLEDDSLAATLADAVAMTRAFDIPYLWIDALCIDQDLSPEQKLPQLSIMDRIYEGAYATLFAFSGASAVAGLSGVGKDRPPQARATIDGLHVAAVYPDYYNERFEPDEFAACVLPTRAWTMQEELLSQRALFFGRDQVHYRCRWREAEETVDDTADPLDVCGSASPPDMQGDDLRYWDLIRRSETESGAGSGSGTGAYGGSKPGPASEVTRPDLRHTRRMAAGYCAGMARDYTERSLTFDHDALDACRGMLNAIQRTFAPALDNGFAWGMPVVDLPLSLLWMHDRNSLQARRRYPPLPSWSFLAWDAPAYYTSSPVAPEDEDAETQAGWRKDRITADCMVRVTGVRGSQGRTLGLEGYTVRLLVRTAPFSEAFVPGSGPDAPSIGMLLQNSETHPTSLPEGEHRFVVVQRVRRVMDGGREHHRLHLLLLDEAGRERRARVQWTVDLAFIGTEAYAQMLEWGETEME